MAYKPSICTMSLGRSFAGHCLLHKLDMAARHGFKGVEVFYEDLVDFAKLSSPSSTSTPSPQQQLSAASTIRAKCQSVGLTIICLQPFMHYEGLVSRAAHETRIQDAKLWLQLVRALGTDLILIPSSNLPEDEITTDMDLIVSDLREVADLGAQQSPPVRFAYEALCWGTRVNLWEESWAVVQAVGRPNFGICLDTFNIAGRIFADPASATGCTADSDAVVVRSLQRMLADVDVAKVFLLQIADGERLSRPLDTTHPFYNAEQPCRMSWSRNARLFYGEERMGAYLPTQAILETIVQGLGFKGWLSFEVFNRRLTEADKGIPQEMARRAARSWTRMMRDLRIEEKAEATERVPAML